MILVHVGEPRQRTIGDVWFDPTTKITSEAKSLTTGLMTGGTAHSIVWIPITVKHSISTFVPAGSVKTGTVFVDAATDIPSMWSGHQWIPAVPATYQFPNIPASTGDVWQNSLTQIFYTYTGTQWLPLTAASGMNGGNSWNIPVLGGAAAGAGNFVIHNTAAAAPQQVFTLTTNAQQNSKLTISGPNNTNMVVIDTATGQLTYGPTYTPDAAAKIFWEAMGHNFPEFLVSTLKSELLAAKEQLQAFADAGMKAPKKYVPVDPNEAWDRAMGLIP